MGPERKPAIVLAHGLVHPLGAATDVLLKRAYFRGVPEFLRRRGFRVLAPRVSNMGHVSERAEQLRTRITAWDELEPGERVVVVGHSMGGLDARWLISNLNGDELIETLVTIGTPHMGCCVADYVVDEVPLMSDVSLRLERIGLSLKALECLTRRHAKHFNEACPDSADVRYFSISGQKGENLSDYSPLLRPTLRYVAKQEGPNDGMVSVKSSIWGEHLGVMPFDHLEQIESLPVYDQVLKRFGRRDDDATVCGPLLAAAESALNDSGSSQSAGATATLATALPNAEQSCASSSFSRM